MIGASLRINGERLRRRFIEMNRIGFTKGDGRTRLALSDEDRSARDLLSSWFADIGLDITIDRVGNMFGKLHGTDPSRGPIILGSHLDTVIRGGEYDGVLGVLAGLEVVETIKESGIRLSEPLWVANWTEEEGTRFAPGLVGSAVWAGHRSLDWACGLRDARGCAFGAELERIGYVGGAAPAQNPSAYFELHIDQGKTLEASGRPIGVPEGIVAFLFANVTVKGRADHVGGMEMAYRRDALRAAAEMIGVLGRAADNHRNALVASVGEMRVHPNSRFTIAEEVIFSVDIRCAQPADVEALWSMFTDATLEIAHAHTCKVGSEVLARSGSLPFDKALIRHVEQAALDLGYPVHPMMSGATHDAANLVSLCPTAMILVPLIDGRSHSPEERAAWADCEAGANVLLHSVLAAAKVERRRAP